VRSRLEFPLLLKPFQIEDLAQRIAVLLGHNGPGGTGLAH